jgi:hypothetical protein
MGERRIRRQLAAAAPAVALALALLWPPAPAPAGKARGYGYRYVVHFTCGDAGAGAPVVPGTYATSVHLLNAGPAAALEARLAVTVPPGALAPGTVSSVESATLDADSALEVDCSATALAEALLPALAPFPAFAQGFVVLESNRPLRVEAVRSAAGAGGEVTLQVEEVPGVRFRR